MQRLRERGWPEYLSKTFSVVKGGDEFPSHIVGKGEREDKISFTFVEAEEDVVMKGRDGGLLSFDAGDFWSMPKCAVSLPETCPFLCSLF